MQSLKTDMYLEKIHEARISMIHNLIDAIIDASIKGNGTEFYREQIIFLSK